jgi:hypothetical protein
MKRARNERAPEHNEKVWRWTSIMDKDARDLTPDQREKLFAEVKRGPQ